MNFKVLLINPDAPEFVYDTKEYFIPPAIIYLASMLAENNIDVKILDLNITKYKYNKNTEHDILKIINEYKPDLVGIGCLFSGAFQIVLSYASLIKKTCKTIKIVIGGMHPTLFYKEIKENCDDIDYIISGEGEIALFKLIKYLLGNISIDEVPALTYKFNGCVITNTKREIIEDLHNLPKLKYDLLNISEYYHDETLQWHNPRNLPINASIPVFTTRGCPFDCTFCCMHNMMSRKCRHRPYMDVVDEIELLYTQYNHCHFSFQDDNLTLNKKNVISLCNEIVKRKLYIQFETTNGLHISTIDKDIVDALCEAGMSRASIAIESGNEYMRNTIMGKHVKTEKIYEVMELLKANKQLFISTFFLIDMPEETNETLQDTFNMIVRLGAKRNYINNVTPFPGTELFKQCIRDNLFTEKVNLNNLWKLPLSWNEHRKKSIKQFFIKPYNMSLEDLFEWRKKLDVYDKHIEISNLKCHLPLTKVRGLKAVANSR